ncbi:MAG: CHAT domain-containing protein, partial [Bacteroidota bacterium]
APAFTAQTVAAPSRQCNEGSLAPLLENEAEVEAIWELISGEVAKGNTATKAFFLKEGMQAQILHLATHACIDDLEPSKSKIFFSDDHLYAHELYQLKLQAQMVVLSACETGVGVFQRGEGVMSLARGFAQSGAPSLTLSYWSVSDQSTAQIMDAYYQFLKQGQFKHQALRNAKQQYLNEQEQLQRLHPYYWSAFVHFGNVEPVKLRTDYPSFLLFIPIGLALIGLSVYLIFIKKK